MVRTCENSSFERKLHNRRIYGIAATVSIAFLVFGVAFIGYLAYLSNLETAVNIQDATHSIKLELDDYITEGFDDLASAAIMTSDRDMTADDAPFARVVRRLSDYNSFVQVGLADLEGNAIWTDKGGTEYGNIAGEPFFQEAARGNNALSFTYEDVIGDAEVNFYAVPVYDGTTTEIKGVLFAADPTEELRAVANRSLYDGQGFASIIDQHGTIVMDPKSPLLVSQGKSIFDLPVRADEAETDALRSNLLKGVSGNATVDVSGSVRRISYEPLAYNNWFVFYSVPRDLVNTEFQTLTLAAVLLILSAFLIFLVFILIIRHINRKNLKNLEQIAFIDPVTGRKNLAKFKIDAEQSLAQAANGDYGICRLDIKDFKYINDLFGREVGNEFIRYFSKSIEETLLDGEDFARIMADNFMVLVKAAKESTLRTRFASLSRRLEVFPPTLDEGYPIELYGGLFLPQDATTNISLVDMADRASVAQKAVKTSGGSERLGFYTPEMHELEEWEGEIASKMERALEDGEFIFYLQPKIRLARPGHRTSTDQGGDGAAPLAGKDSLYGAEVLVRWDSPEHGLLVPGRFVDLFERNGFIVKMDQYIFEQACRFYREEILDKGLTPFPLSANVSRRALEQPGFAASYTAIKSRYRIPDGCIELEFTESMVTQNLTQFKDIVGMLKGAGFNCSLDDFGAGYSSLNVLKSISVDVLKLDRLFFIYGEDAQRGRLLVKDIIAMAKDLGMATVAEGIDEAWQVEELRDWGCDAIQGYVFAQPMPPDEFLEFRAKFSR